MGACGLRNRPVLVEPSTQVRNSLYLENCFETYPFIFRLEDFQLRGPFLEDACLRVRFEENDFTSKVGVYNPELRALSWDSRWAFVHYATVKQLQEQHLVVEVLYRMTKVYATLRLNVYDVASGPMHHNVILFKSQSAKRVLSFNFKVLQETVVRVTTNELKCILEYPPEAQFAVSFKLLHSQELTANQSAIRSKPEWDFRVPEDPSEVPSLSFPASIDDIRSASLQIRLSINVNGVWKLAGECWKSFPRLLKVRDFETYQKETHFFQGVVKAISKPDSVLATLDEDMLHKGKTVGSLKGSVWISNLPFLTQMIAGVRSGQNIELQSVAVIDSSKRPATRMREISLLELFCSQLEKFIAAEASIEPFAVPEKCQLEEHAKTIQEATVILKRTSISYAVSFTYDSVLELVNAQEVMLRLGEHLCEYSDTVHYAVRPFYFECLTALLSRDELNLGSVSLVNSKEFKAKERLARRYAALLLRLLRFTLLKLDFRGADTRVYAFIKYFMAVAYHRVPGFRDKLLEAVQSKMWEDIPEWRRSEVPEQKVHSEEYLPMLNWSSLFYKYIPQAAQSRDLLRVLNDKKWQQVIAKRSIVYFYFLKAWAKHVCEQFISRAVPWVEIPGYDVLVKSFLLELKNRNILTYPEALVKASSQLLLNPSLINSFLEVIFKKANLYRYHTVLECFSVISCWLQALWKHHKALPPIFNANLFIQGLKLALHDEVAETVAKALWLVYRHYHIFRGSLRRMIVVDLLLGVNFSKFAFHWSKQVRKVFFYIILFRIKSLKEFNFEESGMTELDYEIDRLVASEAFPFKVGVGRPYAKLAIYEFKQYYGVYEEWLPRVCQTHARHGLYGPFDKLPYPEIIIKTRYDKGERGFDDAELNAR